MSSANTLKVLAIGLDAAEPSLVQKLINRGSMPCLASLLEEGQWLQLKAPAYIGSGSVWPTFITGTPPTNHGLYSEWIWRPEKMSLERYHGRDLVPFWKQMDQQGIAVGVLDVPFVTPVGLTKGFEVCEWWAHDTVLESAQCGPQAIEAILKESPPHPLSFKRQAAVKPDDPDALRQLTADATEGIKNRGLLAQRLIDERKPAFALIVFPETHHAGHQMWHTAATGHALYHEQGLFADEPLLESVYQEVDRQIAKLVARAGSDTTVMVFALHGMTAAYGSPGFLTQLLCDRGISQLSNWSSQSWSGRLRSILASAKQRSPKGVRSLYYKLAPASTVQRIAQPTMLPVYDWKNTKAFSLPTDQFGWIRVNLEGREAYGSVPLERYDETLDQLEKMLLALKDHKGSPLVHQLLRTVANKDEALTHRIPDLVVHWHDAAFARRLRIADTHVEAAAVGIKTGQHALDGFCLIKGRTDMNGRTSILAEEMGNWIAEMLR